MLLKVKTIWFCRKLYRFNYFGVGSGYYAIFCITRGSGTLSFTDKHLSFKFSAYVCAFKLHEAARIGRRCGQGKKWQCDKWHILFMHAFLFGASFCVGENIRGEQGVYTNWMLGLHVFCMFHSSPLHVAFIAVFLLPSQILLQDCLFLFSICCRPIHL